MTASALARLIAEFLEAQKDRQRATWRMADITVTVHTQAGRAGLHDLARAAGVTMGYLYLLRRTARAFPPGTRRPEISFHMHRIATTAPGRFPAGTAEHEPAFWTEQAVIQGWTSMDQLQHAMTDYTPTDSTIAARSSRVLRRFDEATQHYTNITAAIATFNAVDAPYWGSRLVLVEQPILSPAS